MIYENESAKAMQDYSSFNASDEKKLLEWLVKYETLIKDLCGFLYCFEGEINVKTEYVKLSEDYNLHVLLHDYRNIIQLKIIGEKHHKEMLEKYTTISSEGLYGLENYEEQQKYLMLKLHLIKREMIDEYGIVELKEIVMMKTNVGMQLQLNWELY